MFVRRQADRTLFNGRMSFKRRAISSAFWQWAFMRRASVLIPRNTNQQSIGPAIAPVCTIIRAKAEPALWFWQRLRPSVRRNGRTNILVAEWNTKSTHIQRLANMAWQRCCRYPPTHRLWLSSKGFDVSPISKADWTGFQPNQFDVRFEQLVQIIRIAQIGKTTFTPIFDKHRPINHKRRHKYRRPRQ